jgi:hypothetical protein
VWVCPLRRLFQVFRVFRVVPVRRLFPARWAGL